MGKILAFTKSGTPSSSSLIEELSSLKGFGKGANKSSKGKIKLDSDKPKKKKKDKKKKDDKDKKPKIGLDLDLISDTVTNENGETVKEFKLGIDIDIDKLAEKFEDSEVDDMISKEKGKYSKRRKDKNAFKKEFAEESTLLYNLYDEVGQIVKTLEKTVKGSDRRGTGASLGKNYNDSVSNLLQAKSTQMQLVDKMIGIKKTMADLKFKEDAARAKSGEGENKYEHAAAAFIQQTMQMGRNNFLSANRGTTRPSFVVDAYDEGDRGLPTDDNDPGFDDEDSEDLKNYRRQTILDFQDVTPGYTSEEEADIRQAIADRLDREGNQFRSESGNAFIAMEKKGVEIIISRDIDSDDFEFIAMDKDGEVVHGYPLPQNYGTIKFNGPVATDRYGESYRVREYSSQGNPVFSTM